MPWSKTDYPPAMKNLKPDERAKAIEIANAVLHDDPKDEGKAIAVGIAKAKEVVNQPKSGSAADLNRRKYLGD